MFGSVRARMTLWNVLIVTLTLTVFGLILRFSVERILWDAVDRDLRDRARPERLRFRPPPGSSGAGGRFDGFPNRPGTTPNGADGRNPSGDRNPQGNGDHPGTPGDPGGFGPPFGQDPRGHMPGPGEGQFNGPQGMLGGGMPPPGSMPPPEGGPQMGPLGPPSLMTLAGQPLITGRNSPMLSQNGFDIARTGRPIFTNDEFDGEPIRVFSRPLWEDDRPERPSGRILGVVQVATRRVDTLRAIAGVTQTLLLLLPVALIISGLGGAWLTERALNPVRHLTDAAGQIGATNLAERLPEFGNDEFSRLSAVLNGMLTRLETAFQRERRFTADASHELKTPLAIIKVNTSLALEDEDLPADYQKTLQTIEGAADRANRIVQDLLLLARESAAASGGANPGMPLRRESIPVSSLLREAVDAAGRDAARVRVEPIKAAVWGDRHHLTRLLVNLLANALRHTPQPGTVTLSATADRQWVWIQVRDTGEGIAPEHLPHLTEPFYRVDTARTRESGGSGLGLAICESIARAHGGGLKIESALGVGTTVTVTLPVAEAESPSRDDSASTGRNTIEPLMGNSVGLRAGRAEGVRRGEF